MAVFSINQIMRVSYMFKEGQGSQGGESLNFPFFFLDLALTQYPSGNEVVRDMLPHQNSERRYLKTTKVNLPLDNLAD